MESKGLYLIIVYGHIKLSVIGPTIFKRAMWFSTKLIDTHLCHATRTKRTVIVTVLYYTDAFPNVKFSNNIRLVKQCPKWKCVQLIS